MFSPRSYYNHCYEDPEFAKEAQKIFDGIRTPYVEDILFSLIHKENLGAVKYYLDRRGESRWNYDLQLEAVRQPRLERDRLRDERNKVYAPKRPTAADLAAKRAWEEAADQGLDDIYPNEKSEKGGKTSKSGPKL